MSTSTMKINSLRLTNFKGLRDFSLRAGGLDVMIYAENGVGKTTVADAFFWLFFGKDSLGRKDHEIKTIGPDGEALHFLDHCVDADFEMPGGDHLTLKRTYREDWETQRGASTKTFKGHNTAYEVNGVPQTATEYQRRIASLCEEGQFRLLTDPAAFLNLTWQERRKLLFDVCGDMSDLDVIDASAEIRDLKTLIGSHSIADFKRMTEAQIKALKEERSALPARIDEAMRSLPALDTKDHSSSLTLREADLLVLQEERANLVAGGKTAELRSLVADNYSQRRTIESDYRTRPNPAREAAIQAKREHQLQLDDASTAVNRHQDVVRYTARKLAAKEAELTEKRAALAAEKAVRYEADTMCPACKQALPEDRIEAAVEAFNAAKARKLDGMISAGKALAAERLAVEEDLKRLEALLESAEADLVRLQTREAIVIPEETPVSPESDPEYVRLAEECGVLSQELLALSNDSARHLLSLDTKIAAANDALKLVRQSIADAERRKSGLIRVDELKAREKELSGQYEGLERNLFLCEQFVRAKVRLLTERINSRFRLPVFRLFREQINGGLTECCDVLWRENGALPSHGQSIQIGLDIIATLSEHAGFAPPVFVDNAESLTYFPPTAGQQIRLFVREGDRSMRIVRGDESLESNLSLPFAPDRETASLPF